MAMNNERSTRRFYEQFTHYQLVCLLARLNGEKEGDLAYMPINRLLHEIDLWEDRHARTRS